MAEIFTTLLSSYSDCGVNYVCVCANIIRFSFSCLLLFIIYPIESAHKITFTPFMREKNYDLKISIFFVFKFFSFSVSHILCLCVSFSVFVFLCHICYRRYTNIRLWTSSFVESNAPIDSRETVNSLICCCCSNDRMRKKTPND